MHIRTTMTGSWFRPDEIVRLLAESATGELDRRSSRAVEDAETRAVRDQLHPNGSKAGLDFVSNGEQRKAGYTQYLANRFSGFSKSERVSMVLSHDFADELQESNPATLAALGSPGAAASFTAPKIVDTLQYTGAELAKQEAADAAGLGRKEGAPGIFVNSASPGVMTMFFPGGEVYHDHLDYLGNLSKELSREYRAILGVDGVNLQIDAPDLAMARHIAGDWNMDFFEALPHHVDAINEAIAGLPADRIRVHYCYGNYLGSHKNDADFSRVLPELLRLKAGTIVGEAANPRHEGDSLILKKHLAEHSWPRHMKYAAGVIDVKTPFLETPETIAARLDRFASIDELGPERVLGGTDCGFQTFVNFHNVPYSIGLLKLESLVKGARLESENIGK